LWTPPDKNAVINDVNHVIRNHNLEQIIEHGRIHWQKLTQYSRINYSELATDTPESHLSSSEMSKETTHCLDGN
jgi:hypothetical protein